MCKNLGDKQNVGFAGRITFHNEKQTKRAVVGGGSGKEEDKANV